MSIQAVAWVLDNSQSRGFARLVLISLANHYNAGTGRCDPGNRLLAAEAGIALGSVPNAIHNLVQLGEVEIAEPGGSHRSAVYRLPFVQQVNVDQGSTFNVRSVSVRNARKYVQPRGEQNQDINQEPPLAPATRTRESDPLFEMICQETGIDWTELTPTGRGPLNRAVRELRALDATPGDISQRAGAYRRRYPSAALTPSALVKQWAALGNGARRQVEVNQEVREDPEDRARLMEEIAEWQRQSTIGLNSNGSTPDGSNGR